MSNAALSHSRVVPKPAAHVKKGDDKYDRLRKAVPIAASLSYYTLRVLEFATEPLLSVSKEVIAD